MRMQMAILLISPHLGIVANQMTSVYHKTRLYNTHKAYFILFGWK